MHKISTLENGLTLITVDIPHLDSVTTMIAVGAGSRYETQNINGISFFFQAEDGIRGYKVTGVQTCALPI